MPRMDLLARNALSMPQPSHWPGKEGLSNRLRHPLTSVLLLTAALALGPGTSGQTLILKNGPTNPTIQMEFLQTATTLIPKRLVRLDQSQEVCGVSFLDAEQTLWPLFLVNLERYYLMQYGPFRTVYPGHPEQSSFNAWLDQNSVLLTAEWVFKIDWENRNPPQQIGRAHV